MAIVGIIPARYGSTRLPGKPLSDIHGQTLVQRVYDRARAARTLDRLLVATDDERIAAAVRGFGGEAVMTSAAHPTGTDRLAEVARSMPEAEILVNVQGDEPMLDPQGIDAAVDALLAEPAIAMSTLSVPVQSVEEMLSPSAVKVVVSAGGDALYFSRAPIPRVRDAGDDPFGGAAEAIRLGLARKHVGLYAYRREALLQFAGLPPSPLETAEGLEQLRALAHGLRIRVVPRGGESGVAVDTPEDLERARALLAPGKGRVA